MSKFILAALAVSAFGVQAAQATSPIIVSALRFPVIEANMPRDGLSGSADAIGGRHTTPHAQIAVVEQQLNSAVPEGTALDDAVATLRRAGAHCKPGGACSFFDVQTVDEYVDDIHWNASLQLQNGIVQHVALERYWTRH